MAHPGGRPTKYKPEYCDQIVEYMEKGGKSVVSFAASIGVCRDTIWEWAKTHPEFSVALKTGRSRAQSYWEDILARGIAGEIKGFNVVGAIFLMKNMFSDDWREKQLIEHTGSIQLSNELKKARDRITTIQHATPKLPCKTLN